MQAGSDIRIAFLDLHRFDDESFRGGLLVTDDRTRPFEFRATSPVKPTSFQRILHGGTLTLELYERICLPLIASAKEQITAIFTRDQSILALRPQMAFPVVYLFYKEQTQQEIANNTTRVATFNVHRDFKAETDTALHLLRLTSQHGDVFEPFERVKIALAEVHQLRPEDR